MSDISSIILSEEVFNNKIKNLDHYDKYTQSIIRAAAELVVVLGSYGLKRDEIEQIFLEAQFDKEYICFEIPYGVEERCGVHHGIYSIHLSPGDPSCGFGLQLTQKNRISKMEIILHNVIDPRFGKKLGRFITNNPVEISRIIISKEGRHFGAKVLFLNPNTSVMVQECETLDDVFEKIEKQLSR
ncbi:MAG: hypothetical protein OEV93_04515 [Candidatus Moranbacteria bacterium]|nr:hypothetical protein [Candidatus Moranbacteria bacterium]